MYSLAKAEPPKSYHSLALIFTCFYEEKKRTANEPGALRAAVHPAPRYKPIPSSEMILKRPRPRKASGLVWRLILRTSSGKRTISPIPTILFPSAPINQSLREKTNLPAVACIIAFPVPLPKVASNVEPWCCAR